MKYLLFLFDLDGTLIDSHQAICRALNDTLVAYGKPAKEYAECKRFIGYQLDDVFRQLEIMEGQKTIDIYRQYYFQYIDSMQYLYPGVQDLLKSLHGKMPLAVVTNKGRTGSLNSLKAVGIDGYFDLIVTENDVREPKPSREPLEAVLKYYRGNGMTFEPEDILMIGDSPVDRDFAANCGIDFAFA